MIKTKFDILGMTCSSCSSHVEKAVKKLEGIENVNVNLLSNSMLVEYNENIVNSNNIISAIIDAGYGANVADVSKKKEKKQVSSYEETIKSMKKRLIISICFLIPLMYISMSNILDQWFGIAVPQIIKNIFYGSKNAIIFGFTQALLVLPITYVNRNYFIVGFKRLFKKSPNMDSLIALGSFAGIIYGIFSIYKIAYGLGHGNLELVEKYSMNLYFESAGTILTLITFRKIFRNKI